VPEPECWSWNTPVEFDLWREQVRETVIHIVEPAAGNRLVTAIEVLNPTNKTPGAGYDSYTNKREEFWASGTNLVEIDLLRAGERTVRISAEHLAELPPHHYLVAVTRNWPCRQQIYPVQLQCRLPRVAIPLGRRDKDIGLDLQTVFARCWQDCSYPEVLDHDAPPPGPLTAEEVAWCEKVVQESGLRPSRKARSSRRRQSG
jgi:hypothetical protein